MQYTIRDLCDADKRATDADLKDATEAVTLEDAIILFEAKKGVSEFRG